MALFSNREEVEDWQRRHAEAESHWLREQQWCKCKSPVDRGYYLGYMACKLCGKLVRDSRRTATWGYL